MQETWVQSLGQEDPTCWEQLSPCATTTEPVLQSPGAADAGPARPRAHAWQPEEPLQ